MQFHQRLLPFTLVSAVVLLASGCLSSGGGSTTQTDTTSSTVTTTLSETTTRPGSGLNRILSQGANKIEISWPASPEPDVVRYVIYHRFSSAGQNYAEQFSVDNTTSVIFGTDDLGTHYFSVTAVDTSGNESVVSEETSINI